MNKILRPPLDSIQVSQEKYRVEFNSIDLAVLTYYREDLCKKKVRFVNYLLKRSRYFSPEGTQQPLPQCAVNQRSSY